MVVLGRGWFLMSEVPLYRRRSVDVEGVSWTDPPWGDGEIHAAAIAAGYVEVVLRRLLYRERLSYDDVFHETYAR